MAKQQTAQLQQNIFPVAEAIQRARSDEGAKRNFKQTFEMIINLQHLNVEKTPVKFEYALPKGRGKPVHIGIFADSMHSKAKGLSDYVIDKATLQGMDKKAGRRIGNACEFTVSEMSLMTIVGKNLGPVLAPRGKMPKPIPPQANLEALVSNLKRTVKIQTRKSPIIQIPIGHESQSDKDVEENIRGVLDFLSHNLPRGKEQIKNVYLKLTMGSPMRVDVEK
jgi:large subunit ribosomal protein L1